MTIVDVKNLVVQFDEFKAVNSISFDVNKGEIFGFLGTNGAGKTTTIRVLCGLLIPTSGAAEIAGLDVYKDQLEIKTKIGYMSQRSTLYNDLSVRENLDFIAKLHKLSNDIYLERRKKVLDFIEFDKALDDVVQDLPGGIKRQVSLAASILHDPEIVFLDEPTAGVSPAIRERFWQLIKQLISVGKTIFVTTHYMDEAEQCDRIALMQAGDIIALDSPGILKTNTFPMPLYEFDPLQEMSFAEIAAISANNTFEFFEPYGRRFHAAFKEGSDYKSLVASLAKSFKIDQIQPSLEDVFIKKIETAK